MLDVLFALIDPQYIDGEIDPDQLKLLEKHIDYKEGDDFG